MYIGDIEIVPVPDGTAVLPQQYFMNSDWGPHQALLNADGMVDIPIGCFLLRTGDRLVLVDAGIGPLDGPVFQGGHLPTRLAEAGVQPEDIDTVLCTHLHIDHSGWLVQNGKPFFPNATVRFGAGDWEQFVTNAAESDLTRQAMLVLQAAGRAAPIDRDETIAPGINTVHAPGHTLGHNCVIISSGAERAMLLGDAVTCPVQLEEPDWQGISDIDPALAARTREALWQELEGSETVAVAAHFPDLRFGRVMKGEGRRYFA